MDPRLVNLLENFFAAKEAGNAAQAAYFWATYVLLLRELGPRAIIAVASGAVRTATADAIVMVSETVIARMVVKSSSRLATRAFIKRLLVTLGGAVKPIPPAIIVGIVVIGALSSGKAAYAEGNALVGEIPQYNLYLTNYLKFIARAIQIHPRVVEINPPYTFAEWHEKKETVCLPTTY